MNFLKINPGIKVSLREEDKRIAIVLTPVMSPPTGKIPYDASVLGYEVNHRGYSPIEQEKRKGIEEKIRSGGYLIKNVSFF